MKISTEIGSASELIGEERAIEYLARANFDDVNDDYIVACLESVTLK